MSVLIDNNALKTTRSVINAWSSGGVNAGAAYAYDSRQINTGIVVAGVLKEMLSIAGRGIVTFCSVESMDATLRQLRLKVVADGVTVFDATGVAATNLRAGLIATGKGEYGTATPDFGIVFNSSFSASIASSLSENSLSTFHYKLITF